MKHNYLGPSLTDHPTLDESAAVATFAGRFSCVEVNEPDSGYLVGTSLFYFSGA